MLILKYRQVFLKMQSKLRILSKTDGIAFLNGVPGDPQESPVKNVENFRRDAKLYSFVPQIHKQ